MTGILPARRRKVLVALTALTAALLLGACGNSSSGSSPEASGSADKNPNLGTLKVAFASTQVAPANFVQIAIGEGFYKKLGLDVEIKVLNSPQAAQALIAKQIDIAHAASPGINAALQGAPLKAIYTGTPLGPYWIVANPEIKSYDDLAGKVVGVYSTTGTLVGDTTKVLKTHGVDAAARKVSFSAAGGYNDQAELAAIASGAYNAAVVSAIGVIQAEQKGLTVLGDFGDLPTMDWSIWTTDSVLKGRSAAVDAFLQGTIEGARVYVDNPSRALPYVAAGLSTDGKPDAASSRTAEQVMAKLTPILTPDGVPEPGQWSDAVDRRRAAIPDSKKSATDIADWTFAQKAAKAIDDQGFKP